MGCRGRTACASVRRKQTRRARLPGRDLCNRSARPGLGFRMDLGIRGRVALVTGASSGIGKAVALALGQEGVALAVAARRLDLLEKVAIEAKQRGAADAHAFEVDLDDSTSIRRLLASVRATLGDVDIL